MQLDDFCVQDNSGGSDFSNFTLTVININDPPVIITSNKTIAIINQLYLVDYNATDVDTNQSNLYWSISTNASTRLNMDTNTGILSGTPTSLGWYNVNISVIDGDGGKAWQSFILKVNNPNFPPNIITKENITAFVDTLYQIIYEATDDAPIDLIWNMNTNASWLNFYSATSTLYGTILQIINRRFRNAVFRSQ